MLYILENERVMREKRDFCLLLRGWGARMIVTRWAPEESSFVFMCDLHGFELRFTVFTPSILNFNSTGTRRRTPDGARAAHIAHVVSDLKKLRLKVRAKLLIDRHRFAEEFAEWIVKH